ASFAERLPRSADTKAAKRALQRKTIDACYRRELPLQPFPVAVEFFGQEHAETGDSALSVLGLVQNQRDAVVRRDTNEGIELERRRSVLRADWQLITQHQSAAANRTDREKFTAIPLQRAHTTLSCDAIALTASA